MGCTLIYTAKKNNTVRFLTDFRELNKRLVRKPFPIPKISTVLHELEGFTYATALDLNMGYYTIRLDPDASRYCTIIFPWGKYSYKRLPMGVAVGRDRNHVTLVLISTLVSAVSLRLEPGIDNRSRFGSEPRLLKPYSILFAICQTNKFMRLPE